MKNNAKNYSHLINRLIHYFKMLEEEVPQQEIDELWNDIKWNIRERKPKSKNRIIIISIISSTAATVLALLLFNGIIKFNLPEESIKSAAVSILDTVPDANEKIQLIVSSDKIISIEEGSTVSYSPDGSIVVNEDKVIGQANEKESEEQYNQIIVPKGKHTNLLLSDGSMLHINAGTKVRYPRFFKENKREIYIEGEVFLDVKKNEKASFFVTTPQFEVEVLGTAFNVNAYSDSPNAEVVIVRGKVKVSNNKNQQVNLLPNDLLSMNNGTIVNKKTVDALDYIAWIDGLLICRNEPLGNIFRRLYRYYGTEIVFDSSCENLLMVGKLDMNCPLEEVLRRITVAVPVSYTKEGNTYKITIKD